MSMAIAVVILGALVQGSSAWLWGSSDDSPPPAPPPAGRPAPPPPPPPKAAKKAPMTKGASSAPVMPPKHSLFLYDKENGAITFEANPELRLNVKGGLVDEPGSPLILWPCSPLNHELFKIDNGLIKLAVDENLCLNIEGGANAGAPLLLWPCTQGGQKVPHEEFEFRKNGQIALKQNPDMCLNVEGGAVHHGTKIVLWPCGTETHELFSIKDDYIQVKAKPELHFNIQGELKPEAPVVLWSCQAGPHEALEFTPDSRIRLKMRPEWCLNAEGGAAKGKRIVVWPCSEKPASNELFKYDSDRKVIYSAESPDLFFNSAGGAMGAGDEIVLWTLRESDEL